MCKQFMEKGIYILLNCKDLFLCESTNNFIGKLVLYSKINDNTYNRSGIQYFLNYYKENDIKELFLNNDNYELAGYVGVNFKLTDDKQVLMKEKI